VIGMAQVASRDSNLSEIMTRFESEFPGLAEQIRSLTDERLTMLLSMGVMSQKASSGNTTTPLE